MRGEADYDVSSDTATVTPATRPAMEETERGKDQSVLQSGDILAVNSTTHSPLRFKSFYVLFWKMGASAGRGGGRVILL